MGIILTDNKEKIIEILKKRDEYVLEVTQKVIYAFPKNMMTAYSSEENFLKMLNERKLVGYSRYQVGVPEVIKIKKL